ncbi:MAG: helix-turn-helix transcriptional regulator [Chitinophagaceae bacterium]|nr:helix-turn-helix transcriptional regulator [Chitinophagaceae bacterium]
MTFEEQLYTIISQRIRDKRKYLNISQEEIANKLNVSRASISNMETGKHQVSVISIFELCPIFNCEIFDLIPKFDEVYSQLEYSNSKSFNTLEETQKVSIEKIIKDIEL